MHDFDANEPQSLARMMHLDEGGEALWEPDELGAILQHQLDAPLEFDLSRLGPSPLASVRGPEKGTGPICRNGPAGALHKLDLSPFPNTIHTFRDLFHHPSPPVELLEWTKAFAKSCRSRDDGPVPDEVATVIYFLSIVTAMSRCGKRISQLDDQSLRYGLRWALKQPWVDEATKGCFRRALDGLDD